eukprot:SAG11_NODE_26155_length_349_cov_0.624000_1_plen_59_part_10
MCKVGNALNCPGVNTQCHSWGQGFGDRNGVMLIKEGSGGAFTVESWADTTTLPVGRGQT